MIVNFGTAENHMKTIFRYLISLMLLQQADVPVYYTHLLSFYYNKLMLLQSHQSASSTTHHRYCANDVARQLLRSKRSE